MTGRTQILGPERTAPRDWRERLIGDRFPGRDRRVFFWQDAGAVDPVLKAGILDERLLNEPDFTKFHFKSPEVVDRRWLEWFREEYGRRVYGVDMEPKPDAPLSVEGTARQLPGLSIYSGGCSPMRSQVSADAPVGDIGVLTVALTGDIAFQVGGKTFELKPGAAMFGSGEGGLLDIRTSARLLTVSLSRNLIAQLMPNVSDIRHVSIPADAPATQLLIGYLRMLDEQEAILSPEARHLVTMHIRDLVVLALGPSRDAAAVASGGLRAGRLAAIKTDILGKLSDPDLSVGAVAERHGVTPRYVHMLFEAEGVTFSEYVVGQRLSRAHRMLTDLRSAHQSIHHIALHAGFGDLSYFNRRFRRRFGATPSDVREQARRAGRT